ncbi:MAG: ABC transporter ATP-binding protein, partial [Myxococcota bacterium]
ASLRCLIAGGLMIYTSPTLSGVVLVVGPVLWLGSSILGRTIRRGAGKIQTERGKLQVRISETLKGILTVRVYHREEQAIEEVGESSDTVIGSSLRNIKARALLEGYTNLFSEGAVVLAIWVGAILIVGGSLTPGALVTFILYAGLLTRGASTLSHSGASLMQAQGATNRIFEIGERETRMSPFAPGEIPDTCRGSVEIKNLHFSYPTRPDVAAVNGVSLETRPGEEIALVGASGCGKSTIAKLIARLYDPDAGQVLLDGHDVRSLDSEWLREKITLVPPDPVMFTGSVAENIRFGRPEASDEEMRSAARTAHASEFIEALPEGYESYVGPDGRLLSSGQRQRIALARAVLRGAQVLILDESTAALDTQTEAIVKESLRKLPNQPTLILISHRLSTIIDARRVIVLDRGVVVAEGSHQDLMKTSHFYQELVKDQLVSD